MRSERARSIARAFIGSIATLLLISVVAFAATNLTSATEVARNAIGRTASPSQLHAYVVAHGLNRPLVVRYEQWLGSFVRGDLGTSPVTGRSVSSDVVPRMIRTTILAFASLALALPLSIFAGIALARRHGTRSDVLLMTLSTVVLSALPEFVVGVALLVILSVELHVLPIDSTALTFGSFSSEVRAYILPTLTLVIVMCPYLIRLTRASVRDVLGLPYVHAAVLRGLSSRTVMWRYAFPNAMVPLTNAIALNIVYLLSGVIVVENVFAFPGIGQALVQAVGEGDTVTVLAVAMFMGIMFISVTLAADLAVIYFNPRLRGAR